MKPFPDPSVKNLHVLYDGDCGLCRRCCQWLERQPAIVKLDLTPFQSLNIPLRFPQLAGMDLRVELVAVSDAGNVYRGSRAWIMCLHSLREYREWAQRLSHPALLPLARRLCEMVSRSRQDLSRWLLRAAPEELQRKVVADAPASCGIDGRCK